MNARKTASQIALWGITSAIVCLATIFLRIPIISVNGYVNLGDAFIFLFAALFGPLTAMISGGIGSAIADLIGYPLFAPFTLIIKALEGLIAGFLIKILFPTKQNHVWSTLKSVIAFSIAALEMIALYFFASSILARTFTAGIAEILANLVQGGASIAIAVVLLHATPLQSFANKNKSIKKGP